MTTLGSAELITVNGLWCMWYAVPVYELMEHSVKGRWDLLTSWLSAHEIWPSVSCICLFFVRGRLPGCELRCKNQMDLDRFLEKTTKIKMAGGAFHGGAGSFHEPSRPPADGAEQLQEEQFYSRFQVNLTELWMNQVSLSLLSFMLSTWGFLKLQSTQYWSKSAKSMPSK